MRSRTTASAKRNERQAAGNLSDWRRTPVLISRSWGMRERNVHRARVQRAHFDDYVRETAGGGAAADRECEGASRKRRAHSREFDALERKALASRPLLDARQGESSTRANTGGDLVACCASTGVRQPPAEPREEIGE
jgi:hypothetical protein